MNQDNNQTSKKFDWKAFKNSLSIYSFIKPYRITFGIGMVFLVLSSATSLSFPFFMGKLFDPKTIQTQGAINNTALLLFGILILQGIVSFFRIYLFSLVTEKSSADIRYKLYQKLTSLSISYFDKSRVGELTSRITTDVAQIQDTLGTTLAEFFRQIATLIVGIIMISFISPRLTIFMLSTFPVLVIAAMFFGKFIRKISKQKQDELAKANIVVEETLSAIRVVKAFASEAFEVLRYKKSLDASVKTALHAAKFRSGFVSFIITALFGGIIIVLWYGSGLVQKGEISVGDLTTFILYTAFIGGAVGGLGDLYSQIQKMVGSSERILEILQEPSEITSQATTANSQRFEGLIALQNVSFAYPSRPELSVLSDINFEVSVGEKIAIVGQSGSGKSTITQLLLNFYTISEGRILIDNHSLDNIPLQVLRQNIGIVPQDTILFGGTIMENIRYGKYTATDGEVREAAKKANALGFIENFPDGFETIVGERGVQLSGGQRQRVAIARTILKDPSILILDEATSSLDAESEHLVQQALDELMVGRTSIIIAHRLSTIRNVDKILVLKNGKIMEQGTHNELISQSGYYANLIQMQMTEV